MKRKIYLGLVNLSILFSVGLILLIQNIEAQPPKIPKKQIQAAQKLWDQGETLYRQKKYQDAIERYNAAIKTMGTFPYPSAYFSRGWSHYYLGQYDPAIEDFTTALNQGQPPADVYKIRWSAYYQKKDLDSALKDVLEGLKLDSSNGYLYMAAGDIYRQKNDDRNALSAYEKAAQFEANNADLQYFIAVIHAKLGEPVPQGAAALKAVQGGTKYPGEAWFLVGDSLQKSGKFDESAEAYERAIAAKPALIDVYATLSQVYQQLNRFNDAINVAQKGLKIDPSNGNLRINFRC